MTAASLARMGSHRISPFSPADVATQQLWLKSDALTVVADGTDITTWTDSGPGGTNATATGTKAKYYNNVVNGKPVARWVAGDTRFDSTASSSAAAQTVFVVAAPDLASGRVLLGANLNGALQYYIPSAGALSAYVGGASLIISSANGLITSGAFAVFTCSVSSGSNALWLNGTAIGTSATTFSFTGGLTAQVGAYTAAAVFKGDIAEVIRYTSVLSGSDRIAIHAHLGAKYGITMGGA